MKKRNAVFCALCLSWSVLAGCGAGTPVPPPEQPLPTPTAALAEERAAYPLYLPLPDYKTFYPEAAQSGNIDAFLHNAAVHYYSTRVSPLSGDLLIPSLRLLDEWEDDEGGTYYLCFMAEYDYDPYLRDILPGEYAHDMPGLLRVYLNRYFPDLDEDIALAWCNTSG